MLTKLLIGKFQKFKTKTKQWNGKKDYRIIGIELCIL